MIGGAARKIQEVALCQAPADLPEPFRMFIG